MSEDPKTVEQRFKSGQLVSTPGGIKTAEEAAEMAANPREFTGKTYGKVNAQQGVHMPPPAPAAYTCPDALDLEERVRKAFQELGFKF